MKSDHVWLLVLYFMLVTCLGAQTEYTIPLKGAEYALAVPTMAAGADGTLYVAYRTFSLLRRSANLQLIAYDLNSRRELRRTTVSVPEIRGSRVADGLYISRDGQLLAYAEAQDPSLILLLSTRDLSEIRRSTHLPFTLKDKQRSFAGFDGQDLLSFASDQNEGLRFIRIAPTDLTVISDAIVSGLHQERSQHILW